MNLHHFRVARTARYYMLGSPSEAIREVWFVCHGYGQLASYFVKHFEPLADGTRLIVAPEGLSRFYWNRHTGQVGASWMTKGDREAEIEDYVRYLDALHDHILKNLDRDQIQVRVLGFSQGATTACRWVCWGRVHADQLVMWAGGFPHDLKWETDTAVLKRLRPIVVIGTKDEYISEARVKEELAVLQKHEVPFEYTTFEGQHRMDPDVLRRIAG